MEALRGHVEDNSQKLKELAELEFYARALEWRTDLWRFNTECLGNNPDTHEGLAWTYDPKVKEYVTWVGDKVLDWFQTRRKQEHRRNILVLVPRKCGKSTMITESLPVWLNLMDPNISVCISSHGKFKAEQFLGVAKNHMEGHRPGAQLINTYGPFHDSDRVWRQDQIVSARRTDRTRKDPTIWATGVEVGAGGTHPDVYIWDDPVVREKVGAAWFDSCWAHYLDTFPVIGRDGLFILIMTPYSVDDPQGRVISREIEPAVYKKYGKLPEDFRKHWYNYAHLAGWEVYFQSVYDDSGIEGPGHEAFPLAWPHPAIQKYRNASEAEYSAQLGLRPGVRKDAHLGPEHIDRSWVDPDDVPADVWNKVTVHMDLAWKDYEQWIKDRGDFSVIQCWGHSHNGHVYYLPIGWRGKEMQEGFKRWWLHIMRELANRKAQIYAMTYDQPEGGFPETLKILFQEWGKEIAPGYSCPPQLPMKRGSANKKPERIILASRYWIEGRVKLVRGAPHAQDLANEMLGFGSGHDDMADAAADVFSPDIFQPTDRSPVSVNLGRRGYDDWEGIMPEEYAAYQNQMSFTVGTDYFGELKANVYQ